MRIPLTQPKDECPRPVTVLVICLVLIAIMQFWTVQWYFSLVPEDIQNAIINFDFEQKVLDEINSN